MSLKNMKVIKNKLKNNDIVNSTNLIEDDSDSCSCNSISWAENEILNNEDLTDEELDENDEIVNLSKLTKTKEENIDVVNDITLEITKDEENNKCVKVSVSLDIESSNDIINIEFLISKETYLKLANQLK
jgi:hypothetical protein